MNNQNYELSKSNFLEIRVTGLTRFFTEGIKLYYSVQKAKRHWRDTVRYGFI